MPSCPRYSPQRKKAFGGACPWYQILAEAIQVSFHESLTELKVVTTISKVASPSLYSEMNYTAFRGPALRQVGKTQIDRDSFQYCLSQSEVVVNHVRYSLRNLFNY